MQPNRLRRAIDEPAGTAVGSLVMLEGGGTARVLARSGYDFLVVDVQHGAFGASGVDAVLGAVRGADCAVIVRVAAGRPDQIEWVLDQGAHGVMVPLVNNADDARRAVAACRYPPRGSRSVGGVRNLLERGPGYLSGADDDVVCIVQIEHVAALSNLDEILAVPGIDLVTPGHVDLARSMGYVADYGGSINSGGMAPDVQDALREIRDACARHGIPHVPVAGSQAEFVHAAGNGDRIVCFSSDYHQLRLAVTDNVEACRKVLGEGPAGGHP
ncbi:HpcH/HpaI aldolase family protein [Saccharopolyspora spinosa]|uniref:2-dehydro-3-deoxyglucarate aldolase/4-hydroxy-2-oxoheptanedioate aldolase n=1 Tax=Saccharopolyspora spinosa TaxID=60894 RepID=A0A2N3Y1I0_SACSN|nr:aldolase/citrate lyase family protein [Saccharopolyspora spinosa]PKW16769.1 2-dehydro-3-deoxyglucarate aldolase/4-hydroxy-2-oxoheptanedioate aldolase [Saccharopolyspora spinosa]